MGSSVKIIQKKLTDPKNNFLDFEDSQRGGAINKRRRTPRHVAVKCHPPGTKRRFSVLPDWKAKE